MKTTLQVRCDDELKNDFQETANGFNLSVSEYVRVLHIISKDSNYKDGKLRQSSMDKIDECLTYFKKKVIQELNNKNNKE